MVSPPEPTPGRDELGPPPPPPHPARRGRFWRVFGIVAASLVALLTVQVVVAAQLETPWMAFEPGTATQTSDMVGIVGADVYDSDGEFLYLTVRQNRLSALEWVLRARDPYVDIQRERDLFGDLTRQETRQLSQELMVRSKTNAELVALDYLGYDVYETTGVQVVSTEEGSAADGVLEPGMVITAVDATPVPDAETLIGALRQLDPGTQVTLAIEQADGSDPRTVDITLGERPDGTGGGFLGIGTNTRFEEAEDIPISINIDSGDVGGNSAGLAFALSIIDALTPGSLMGDNVVAVTGTIELNGSVGDVGGVAQKAVAARRAGATHLLVPRNLEEQALRHSDHMVVIPVSTLDEALDALASLGGNAADLALGEGVGAN